jgi:uncharacterized protein (DUF362 family)
MNHAQNSGLRDQVGRPLTRRKFLLSAAGLGLGAAAIGVTGLQLAERLLPKWDTATFGSPGRAKVAVLRATDYNGDLERVIRDGIREVGVQVAGRSVLLKPNMVEFDPGGVINTDPRLIAATAAVMRSLGARSVTVGEGPGHRRDTQYMLERSGLLDLLADVDTPFIDLNTAAIAGQRLESSYTSLGELWLPRAVTETDLVVSMPKMKTHHWGGVTLSLKNLFGCVPGRVYGWPKNILHWAGLEDSILDVAALVRPGLAIVDGIIGMEGDGPIKGTPIASGHVVVGTDPVAVDVTAARLMGVDAQRIYYLTEAARFLGQGNPDLITQVGEDPDRSATPFELLPDFAHLRIGST